jgi:hypothetical protein
MKDCQMKKANKILRKTTTQKTKDWAAWTTLKEFEDTKARMDHQETHATSLGTRRGTKINKAEHWNKSETCTPPKKKRKKQLPFEIWEMNVS